MNIEKRDGFSLIRNANGPTLGFSPESGVDIIERDGLYFKDLSKTGKLLPYEDWRLAAAERAGDLAARLSIEQIAGLMLYSTHQAVPFRQFGLSDATYDGKSFDESGKAMWELTDQQKEFLVQDRIRHVLVTLLQTPEAAAKWNNTMQALVEGDGTGIPVNISSDPRHGSSYTSAEFINKTGATSVWPQGLGMAATFDPGLCQRFGEAIAEEYRALGITTALHPQVDLATEPRWLRFGDTFGEHPMLAADMCRAYCDGIQTTKGSETGWGAGSVAAMVKHWPGGTPCEGGRDAHYAFGKYAVYPGDNFDAHLIPFTEGAFKLNGPTQKAAAVMPYYSIAVGQDAGGEAVGNAYSHYMITELLREKYGYDGVVCTDWSITGDNVIINSMDQKNWGAEHMSIPERHLKVLMAGCDQFGGNDEAGPILEAYKIGCERYGEAAMRARFEKSAARLLRNSFNCGLFENPYLDPDESARVVGHAGLVAAGLEAQRKSVVLMKNKNNLLPLKGRLKAYIPNRHIEGVYGFYRTFEPAHDVRPVEDDVLLRYFDRAATPEAADIAIVFIDTPITDAYSEEDVKQGGNGYLPHSLQYRPYTAVNARAQSMAGGHPQEDFTNRSYRGKTVRAANESDLDNVLEMRRRMGTKPVIVVNAMNKPTIPAEFEPSADAIVGCFNVKPQAIFDILTGAAEPSALLPMQIPRDMETVEAQCEDVPFDMAPYTDECGNVYDFGFGMNWSGPICDARRERYKK